MDSIWGLTLLTFFILMVGIWLGDRRSQLIRHRLLVMRQERDLARDELNQLRLERDAITQSVSEGILLVDANEQITFVNQVARRILDLRAGTKLSLNDLGWWFDLQSLIRDVIAQRTEALGQTIVKDERAFQVNAYALPEKARAAAIILIQEVTELQRLGRMRRDFVANISHELRTPVATLQLLVETLAKELPPRYPLLNELVQKQQEQVSALHQLAEEMMGLALIESGQMPIRLIETRVIDLVQSVVDVLRVQAERKEIQIELQVPSELCAWADSTGVRKVLNNLLHNAIKFTPSKGRIVVSACGADDNIEIKISDTGMGIPARDLPRIFERFYKVDQARTASGARGTGLGLAIAKHIVEGHGGKIWAESVEGKGSIFYFTLPACGESN
jgi:two-component system phosphate regulon sensor histidine kinase PhoR